MINNELKKYLKEKIIPLYQKNDWSHQSWHVYEVIKRSLNISKNLNVNKNMVYTIAVFHDIAYLKEKGNHKINSAKILETDEKLKSFFTNEEIETMKEAIILNDDSLKSHSKNIYRKIISSAERATSIKEMLRSTVGYYLEFYPEMSGEEIFEQCYNELNTIIQKDKIHKILSPSNDYETFLNEVNYYFHHQKEFKEIFYQIDKFLRKKYNLPQITYPQIKRYYTIDDYLKKRFGTKVYKVSLNAGFSCPNKKNGTGCIFCSNESGDFAGNQLDDIKTQFKTIQRRMAKKWKGSKYIAYFQAGTNTYAPLHVLKEKYEEALTIPGVIGLSIATRSDAISNETLDYLEQLNQRTFLNIELGLQSMHAKTLKQIMRGHTLENFENMVLELRKRNINVVVHIINGLPGETKKEMIETVEYLNTLPIQGIKIHMLHVLKNTPLAKLYQTHPFKILSKEEYIEIVCDQIERLNQNITIHRVTGDPKKEDLMAPFWLLKKFVILNDIDKELKRRNTYQGKLTR